MQKSKSLNSLVSKVLAQWRKTSRGEYHLGLRTVPVKYPAKKIGSQKYSWKYFKLKSTAIVHQPHKIQELRPVPKNYIFLNSPPSSPKKNAPLIPVSVNMASPPLGFAVNIFKSFPVARVDAAKILVLVVHKRAKNHRQTCNFYKKPLIVCGYSDLSIPGSVSC